MCEYLTPAQLVARWNDAVCVGTLSNWRHKGEGPRYVKFGRSVRYPVAAVLEYEAAAGRNPGGSPEPDKDHPTK